MRRRRSDFDDVLLPWQVELVCPAVGIGVYLCTLGGIWWKLVDIENIFYQNLGVTLDPKIFYPFWPIALISGLPQALAAYFWIHSFITKQIARLTRF